MSRRNLEWAGESHPRPRARQASPPPRRGARRPGHLAGSRRRRPATRRIRPRRPPPDETDIPEEPDWLRDAPRRRRRVATPARRPGGVAAALEARRAARAEEIVARLNPEQARAVTTTDGPLLILAGAGSGKTRVVAHRIAYLIGVKARPAPPDPRRHVHEPRGRRAPGADRRPSSASTGKDVEAGTFHALCARVLRRDGEAIGLDRRFVIYDTDDQQQLMKRILAEEDLPATGEFRPAAILGAISRAKNEMLDEAFLAENAVNHQERMIARLARPATGSGSAPRTRSTSTTCCCEAVRAVRERARGPGEVPGALALPPRRRVPGHEPAAVPVGPGPGRGPPQPVRRGRRRPVDLRLARRQRPEHPRLRARLPGRDGRQAGAELPLHAADPRRRPRRGLAQRARGRTRSSGPRTRAACRSSASRPTTRTRRRSGSPARSRGWSVRPAGARCSRAAPTTTSRPASGRKDVAVMYRMNAQSRAIEEAFLRYGIRYQLVGGTRFYQRREVKDALAYLRVLRSDTDVVVVRADHQRAGARRSASKSIEALRRYAVRHGDDVWAAVEAGAAGRGRGARAADPDRARRVRGRWCGGCATRIGVLPLPELLDEVLEASGLPGDARRRLRGGRGTLGEPARAARGDHPLRRPLARGRAGPAARGDGARRRPGHVRGRGGRRHADHAPRGEGPRVPGGVHRRAGGGPVPAQPGARRREGAGGGAAARVRRASRGRSGGCSCPTPGAARRGVAAG